MKTLFVSVIIPAYNRAAFLKACIDSVLAQTCRDFELIVVDDGSTDSTPAVLSGYADRITVITTENRGPSAARNTGIAAASAMPDTPSPFFIRSAVDAGKD